LTGVVLASVIGGTAAAQTIEDLEQRIKVLERKLEIDKEAAATAAVDAPVVRASSRGFSLQSKDAAYNLRLRGLVHFDYRNFTSDDGPDGGDTFTAQRVRPTIEGTIGKYFDFRLMADFGQGRTVLQDAYVVGRFDPGFAVTLGKFKAPFGIERLQSSTVAALKATGWTIGVSWYLTGNVKALLNYENTSFDGGAAGGDRPDEKVVLVRTQLAF